MSAQKVVTAYIEALNAADIDRITACVTDDFWNEHVTVSGNSLRGRAAYAERLKGFLAAYRDMTYTIDRLMIDGDDVALEYTMTYNWHGAQPPRPVATRGVFLFEMRDGLIAHRTDYRDSAHSKAQAAPTMPPPAITTSKIVWLKRGYPSRKDHERLTLISLPHSRAPGL